LIVPDPVTDAVARDLLRLHAEVGAIVLDEHVIFFEAAGIEQDAQALAGGQPALGVLRCDPLFAPAQSGCRALFSSSSIVRRQGDLLGCASFTRRSSGQSGALANAALQQIRDSA
jgi:hypothetical protein